MYIKYNSNPKGIIVGDCTVRAISKALDKDWDETYMDLCLQGYIMKDMPSSNVVWGLYLKTNGFNPYFISSDNDDYSISDFCLDNPVGTYIVETGSHVVCVIDGDYYDSWDSGSENLLYYWKKQNEETEE